MIKGVIQKLIKSLLNSILRLHRYKILRKSSKKTSETSDVSETTSKGQTVVKNDDAEIFRKSIGEWLKNYRVTKELSIYKVAKDGNIRIEQVQSVESGETNYTINIFFGYLKGCELDYLFATFLKSVGDKL